MNNRIYIYIKEYNTDLAKRQPWYTIRKLKSDLEAINHEVEIITNLKDLPESFDGHLIKTFSLKDLITRKPKNLKLTYLVTFPIYGFNKFFKMGFKILRSNWRDLKRILLMSLIPSYVLKRVLNKADNVLTISDRSYNYLCSLGISSKKYYPFIFGNWGGVEVNNKTSKTITLGYFGPPYSTRCFDKVVDFFEWISHNGYKFEKKIITRIEKKNLLKKEGNYRSKFENANIKVVSGFLSRERLTAELLEIDVFILPFEIVMSELPIVVLESLELNRKVISTPDSGVSNLVTNNKNMFILDEFSQKNYNSIIEFINKPEVQDFSEVRNKIIQNNKKTLKSIWQR